MIEKNIKWDATCFNPTQNYQAPLADWGGSELIIRLQAGSIPAGRTSQLPPKHRIRQYCVVQ